MRVCMMIALFALLLSPALLSAPVFAQTEDPILSMPDGQVILNISATERREVEEDLLIGTLSYVVTGRDAHALQNEINSAMKKALDMAKKVEGVKVSTGAYQVYETTDARTKEKQWRGSQSLTLKSKASDDLLKLAGDLQDLGLTMNGLNYTLAPETAVKVEDDLLENALKQLQERADRAAKALGKSSAELRDVNVSSSGIPYPQPMYARAEMMMASSKMAEPVAAAGESTITLSVNARALLKP